MLPPLNTFAKYTVKSPFTLTPNTVYQCIAIRRYEDLIAEGRSVYDAFYTPNGLSDSDYQRDLPDGMIVTLRSPTTADIQLPLSYIQGWDLLTTVAYSRVMLGVDLGLLPDTDDIEHLKERIQAVIETAQGQRPDVSVYVDPTPTVVTQTEHDAFVKTRAAARTNRASDWMQLCALKEENRLLREKLQTLEQLFLKHYQP